MVRDFLSEIKGIMDAYTTFNIKVFCFDTEVYNEADFTADNLPPFDHPDPVIATVSNIDTLTLNAVPQQITSQRSIGVEVSRDGAAPAFVTVTVNANNTTA